jgi:prepilin-type N-terminal cleavage/methylation domain-containing protein
MTTSNAPPVAPRAFTLIEIMVTLMIVTTLIAIAMPQFLRAREVARARGCLKNLNTIIIAKEQYGMDNHLSAGATMPALSVLCGAGTATYIKTVPICPSSGTYTLGNLGVDPTCSFGTTLGTTEPFAHVVP